MGKSTIIKFIFLILVGGMLAIITLSNLVGKGNNLPDFEEQTNNLVYTDSENTSEIEDILIDEEDFEENREPEEVEERQEDVENTSVQSNDIEQDYVELYGMEAVDEAKRTSSKVVQLWLHEETDKTMWEGYITSSLFDSLQERMVLSSDEFKPHATKMDVQAIDGEQDEMIFSVLATWEFSNGEMSSAPKSTLFYVTLTFNKNEWLANELLEP